MNNGWNILLIYVLIIPVMITVYYTYAAMLNTKAWRELRGETKEDFLGDDNE